MPKNIVWSELADKDFDDVLGYLNREWGGRVVNNFMDVTFRLIEQIAVNPKQFPMIHKEHKVRKCVLTKQNTLFYREAGDEVEILRIFDTRQDPKKLKFD